MSGVAVPAQEPSADELRAELDLYRRLLELGFHDELEPFIEKALGLVVQIAQARCGFLEIHGGADSNAEFSVSHASPPEDEHVFRRALSRGVIAEAIASGKTVATASAVSDPRFRDRGSVRRNRIEAVLCTPIQAAAGHGVIYLQDRHEPGSFTERDRERVETFARHVAPFFDRLLMRRGHVHEGDPTEPHRKVLHAERVVGRSKAIARVLQQVTLIAPHSVGVLLTGPTGTGKTQLARVIHESGPRSPLPFVELNCAALPVNLIENELFGAVAGAHSTAVTAAEGKVAAADGGTLFLDEIGELSLSAQSKLLQLLQSGEYYPLGSSKPRKADIRVIAATNSNLEDAIEKRLFREDLYYRLNVLPIRMPALAERATDVPLLAAHFCAAACESNGLPSLTMSRAALSAAEVNEWPGNVRQLANAIEAAVLRAAGEGAEQVEARHVFPDLEAPDDNDDSRPRTYQQHLTRFKRRLLARTLEETHWNISEAARRLDLARSHVNKLIRVLGLQRSED